MILVLIAAGNNNICDEPPLQQQPALNETDSPFLLLIAQVFLDYYLEEATSLNSSTAESHEGQTD